MATQNNLREELLKQGLSNGTISASTGTESLQKIIAEEAKRVRRMKKLTKISWIVLLAWLLIGAIVAQIPQNQESHGPRPAEWVIVLAPSLLMIAVVFTVSLYVRERKLTTHQIQASLAGIEATLKQLSQKNQ